MKGVKRSLVDYLEGLFVDYMRWALGSWQAFLIAPLTPRESEAMGVRSEKSAGVAMKASLERFSFEGLGLQFYFSFQTPIRASELHKAERQFDLFVSVKGTWTRFNLEQRAPDQRAQLSARTRATFQRLVMQASWKGFLYLNPRIMAVQRPV